MVDEIPVWSSEDEAELAWEAKRRQLGRVAEFLIEEIRAFDIEDTGRLARSVKVDMVKGEVVMTAPYGKWVNEGRKSGGGIPPYDHIRKWVGHKLGIANRKQARSVAWAIMEKIHKKGIPAKHIVEEAWKNAQRNL